MATIQELRKQIDELNTQRNFHIAQRSDHDKKGRELDKKIRAAERELLTAYTAAPTPEAPKEETPHIPEDTNPQPQPSRKRG